VWSHTRRDAARLPAVPKASIEEPRRVRTEIVEEFNQDNPDDIVPLTPLGRDLDSEATLVEGDHESTYSSEDDMIKGAYYVGEDGEDIALGIDDYD
jgi:hypothetical protein